ncbi:MAG: PEP-CTERM sorting domain-containing protein [gamma proteobacterium endosymbiont of Lamellibrachia anaximandri]|nr:PEP-CTERM sorting domain-containing protein [gamma proteobacterium endosymbiont of Lamellibrachia anaximandri]MBL3532895.1 PEP-CTERM sorting domain-containing protein [gamma proteobacterium endosymbiont of Lamellibrachia anaximandri]
MKTKSIFACFSLALFSTLSIAGPINPGFESGLSDWTTSGVISVISGGSPFTHTGTKALNFNPMEVNDSAQIYQEFTSQTHHGRTPYMKVGGWFKLFSDDPISNFETINIEYTASLLGGGIATFTDTYSVNSLKDYFGANHQTDWLELFFYTGPIYDVDDGPTHEFNSSLSITLLDDDFNPATKLQTGLSVDDVYAINVSEPSALFLMGSGLIALINLRRLRVNRRVNPVVA